MAKIKPEEIVEDLSAEFRGALADAVKAIFPGQHFNEHALFLAFKLAIRRKCRTWERVRDSHVDPKD